MRPQLRSDADLLFKEIDVVQLRNVAFLLRIVKRILFTDLPADQMALHEIRHLLRIHGRVENSVRLHQENGPRRTRSHTACHQNLHLRLQLMLCERHFERLLYLSAVRGDTSGASADQNPAFKGFSFFYVILFYICKHGRICDFIFHSVIPPSYEHLETVLWSLTCDTCHSAW